MIFAKHTQLAHSIVGNRIEYKSSKFGLSFILFSCLAFVFISQVGVLLMCKMNAALVNADNARQPPFL
jgi:hypothetical protein